MAIKQGFMLLAIAILAMSICGCIFVHPGIVHVTKNFTYSASDNVTVYVAKGSQDNVTVIKSSYDDVEVTVDSTYEKGKSSDTIGDMVTFSWNERGLLIYVDMTKLAEGQEIQKYSAFTRIYMPANTTYSLHEVNNSSAFPT
jgi:hypothetical protein